MKPLNLHTKNILTKEKKHGPGGTITHYQGVTMQRNMLPIVLLS